MKQCQSILVVDDDAEFRRTLADELRQSKLATIEAGTIAQASQVIEERAGRFDAILMDITLPDGDGRSLCLATRTRYPSLPILLLSGRDDETDIVNGFACGASDYVRKPVRLAELQARLRAHRRSIATAIDTTMPIGRYTFRPSQRTLFDGMRNQRIWLTAKESGILYHLFEASGRPVNRESLLRAVWGLASDATTHTLETHIYRLRQKLGDEGLLLTGRGGYSLAAA